jgi:WD40 repeat protein
VRLWEAATGRSLAVMEGHGATVGGVALSADGTPVASSGADGMVRLWDASTGRALASLAGHVGAVWRVALSADGEPVASAGDDGSVRLWEAATAPHDSMDGGSAHRRV